MAGLITQSMSGRPASGLMFFLGMDTEPPRAGIIAMTRGLAVAILLVRAVAMAKLSLRASSGQPSSKEYFPRFWEACGENFGEPSPTTTTTTTEAGHGAFECVHAPARAA